MPKQHIIDSRFLSKKVIDRISEDVDEDVSVDDEITDDD